MRPPPWFARRWTIRTRLAVLSAMVFLAAGSVLVVVTYTQMRRAIYDQQVAEAVIASTPRSPAADPQKQSEYDQKIELYEQQTRDEFRQEILFSMIQPIGLTVLALLAVGLGLGWLVARQSLRPVQEITATARRVAGGNLSERIGLTGPRDELRELADTFDHMLSRLDAAFESQRRFVANASHELRTPLTINRTLIEVALGRPDAPPQVHELGSALMRVNDRQQQMIDGLLALAESERSLGAGERVNLAEIVRATVGLLRPEADRRGIALAVVATDAYLAGDPVLLERLSVNLVQNAIVHNVDGGRVWVSCTVSPDEIRLRVENTGQAIPPDRLDEIFEPFRRLVPRSRSPQGSGLGLSIARAVAAAHSGTVTAHTRRDGGLVVVAALRATDPAPGAPRSPDSIPGPASPVGTAPAD